MRDHSVLVAGETLFDLFPTEGEGLESAVYERRAGGAPANVAVGLARLGRSPLFWTRVGDDVFGDTLLETLRSHGLPDTLFERDEDAHTTLAFVDQPSESFLFYRGADARLSPETTPVTALDTVEWVALGGVALSASPARAAVTELLHQASERDVPVLFDPNYRPELWEEPPFDVCVRERLNLVDVLKATRAELSTLFPTDADLSSQAASALSRGPHTVCVTEGSAGARLFSSSEAPWEESDTRHPGYDVHAVDPVGAGDAFNAGLLTALLEGIEEPAKLLGRANAVAAIATTQRGAMTALPRNDEVQIFLDEHESGPLA